MPLPALPIELQYPILILLEPNQLFTLRRVSRSWNIMLNNTQLLEDINNQLPFLSSAPDLTSRMKRRMRMARGDPVWVKSYSEAFPWTNDFGTNQVIKFWKGWVGVMSSSIPCSSNNCAGYRRDEMHQHFDHIVPNGALWQRLSTWELLRPHSLTVQFPNPPVIKFRIQSLAKPDDMHDVGKTSAVIEVDIVATLRSKLNLNPEAYGAGVSSKNCPLHPHVLYFSLEDGKVVVGLEQIGTKNEHQYDGSYFFVFSISTGNLIQYFHQKPSPFRRDGPQPTFLFARVNKTHFLTIYQTSSRVDPNDRVPRGSRPDFIYGSPLAISTFSLDSGTQLSEISITCRASTRRDWGTDFDFHYTTIHQRLRDDHIAFDHLGRLWIPFTPGGIVGTACVGTQLSESNPENENTIDDFVWTMPMDNLPKSPCGKWSLVPVVAGLQRQVIRTPRNGGDVSSGISEPSYVYVAQVGSQVPGHQFKSAEEQIIHASQRSLFAANFNLVNKHTKELGLKDGQMLRDRTALAAMRTKFGMTPFIGSIDIGGTHRTKFRNHSVQIPVDDWGWCPTITQSWYRVKLGIRWGLASTLWGYVAQVVQADLPPNSNAREEGISEEFEGIFSNLCLLPFHSNQKQHESQLSGKVVSDADRWIPIRNGLRKDLILQSVERQDSDEIILGVVTNRWVLGDDGLIGWYVQEQFTGFRSRQIWIVCYEEDWVA